MITARRTGTTNTNGITTEEKQKAIDDLRSGLAQLRNKRAEMVAQIDAEITEVQATLAAIAGGSDEPAIEAAPSVRSRILDFATTRSEFGTPEAIEHIYGNRYVERGKYGTVSSALAVLVREGILEKPERGRFRLPIANSTEAPTVDTETGASADSHDQQEGGDGQRRS